MYSNLKISCFYCFCCVEGSSGICLFGFNKIWTKIASDLAIYSSQHSLRYARIGDLLLHELIQHEAAGVQGFGVPHVKLSIVFQCVCVCVCDRVNEIVYEYVSI